MGIAPGWHCLEVGAGHGGMARWLAETVGDDGRVMATDIDIRFLVDMPANVIVREHDIAVDPLPAEPFRPRSRAGGAAARAPTRSMRSDRMIDATKPGGWLLIEDIDWLVFDNQELPEPFATLHHTVRNAYTANAGYDGEWGRRMLATMRAVGLVDVELAGHGPHDARRHAERGVVRDGARAGRPGAGRRRPARRRPPSTPRSPRLASPTSPCLSPLSISAWGRKARMIARARWQSAVS